MVKNLIYDFGRVLVNVDFEGFFHSHIPDDERCRAFMRDVFSEELLTILDREAQPLEVILEDLVGQYKEYEAELRMFFDCFPGIIPSEMEGMRDLLTRLKAEGYRLYGLTNWCSKVHLTMEQYGIFRLLDGYVISSEEHLVKPEPEIYQRLFDKYGLMPEECLFADDRLSNIEGGRRVGMDGIVFQDAQQYERDLRRMLTAIVQ